jgi:hypothetical protein
MRRKAQSTFNVSSLHVKPFSLTMPLGDVVPQVCFVADALTDTRAARPQEGYTQNKTDLGAIPWSMLTPKARFAVFP